MEPETPTTSEVLSQPSQSQPSEQSEATEDPSAAAATEESPSFSWEASQFVQHDKPAWWYLALVGATVALAAVFVLLHQPVTIALVVVMAVAVAVYSRKQPRTLRYTLDQQGVTIQAKLLPYNHFRSYSLHSAVSWREVELEPAKRFSPRLTLLVSNENFDTIEHILSLHLPKVERPHDLIERLARSIKF